MANDIQRSEEQSRYEIRVDGDVTGIAEYRNVEGRVVFTHTEIDDGHEGEGLGKDLVRGALDDIRERGLRIVPRCKFVAGFIERNQEYRDLVDEELQARL